MSRVLLNLGCGLVAPETWRNYDASLHLYIAKFPWLNDLFVRAGLVSSAHWPSNVSYLNLNRQWPFTAGSVDVVYAHHVFEHLTTRVAKMFLLEARRVLRPGGVLRLVVPDLRQHAQVYLNTIHERGAEASRSFLWAANLQLPETSSRLRGMVEALSGYPSMHKTMYDEPSLSALISAHGFRNIEHAERGVSARIPELRDVEYGEYDCSLYLEGEM